MALAAGVAVGLIGGERVVPWFGWMGDLIVRLLKMVIVPLVFTSIVSGVASVGGGRDLGRLFSKTLGYYMLSSLLAALIGLVLVNAIRPGDGFPGAAEGQEQAQLETPTTAKDMLLRIVPENVVDSMARLDMLGVIFFCILLGMSIATLPEKPQKTLMEIFQAGFEAMMKLTGYVIRVMPFGVFGLIVKLVGTTGLDSFKNLGLYMVMIASGLTIHLFVTLPLLLLLLGRIKPSIHFRNMADAMLMAFSTSSSAATLPVTLRSVEKKVGVSNRVTSFVLPMGATVNMDGTALYECAGVIFIAQALPGVELTILQQAVVVLTALLASIGAAAVPSAGLVIIFIVLQAVGLGDNPEALVLVGAMLAIDRPLDMYRTVVNVFSDSCGAAIIARSEGEDEVDTKVVYTGA